MLNRKAFQVFGANTNVGKTIISTALCKHLNDTDEKVSYLKPIQTGYDFDHKHVSKYSNVLSENLYHYGRAASPHLSISDSFSTSEFISGLSEKLKSYSPKFDWTLMETAGGVLTPITNSHLQADLYRPLRLPTILIADPNLGGISATISAYESLKIRGFDIVSILSLSKSSDGEDYGNIDYFKKYFSHNEIISFENPPRQLGNDIHEYYSQISSNMAPVVKSLKDYAANRKQELNSMSTEAENFIWYPFSQHREINKDTITTIDSAHGNDFHVVSKDGNEIVPFFDGSASWWTQGLGHGNPELSLVAAEAAGRYGHVILANTIHKPALELAKKLLQLLNNPKLSKVFYSDNGSTGIEVAIKMALKATCDRYGWDVSDGTIGVIGLQGSYHGDTIGSMDCSEPSVFNKQITWYQDRGYWFDYPTVKMQNGEWTLDFSDLGSHFPRPETTTFDSFESVFDLESRDPEPYKFYIKQKLEELTNDGKKFGALLLEPVLLGAGGMKAVDPLFQYALVESVRETKFSGYKYETPNPGSWSGLPVVYDEVFSGLYRLGRPSSSSFIQQDPDISVHAKVLTGGMLPLCVTTASESIFQTFLSDSKSDALLHGHSYTAHPVGCSVALESLNQLENIVLPDTLYWTDDFVKEISRISEVDGVFSLGTVLSIYLKDEINSYQSTIGQKFHQKLRALNIHTRPLGNVVYFMCGQATTRDEIESLQNKIKQAFHVNV